MLINCKQYLKKRPHDFTSFDSRIIFPKILLLVLFTSFSVDSADEFLNGKCARISNLGIGERISI